MLTINLLQALPKTPLWDRLERDGRLLDGATARDAMCASCGRTTRCVAMWRRCIAYANDPERLFARFHHQVDATYVNRMSRPRRASSPGRICAAALVLAFRVMLHIGLLSDYRKPFWRAARHALRHGQIDARVRHGLHRATT